MLAKALAYLGLSTGGVFAFGLLCCTVTPSLMYYVGFFGSAICMGINVGTVGRLLFRGEENADNGETGINN